MAPLRNVNSFISRNVCIIVVIVAVVAVTAVVVAADFERMKCLSQ